MERKQMEYEVARCPFCRNVWKTRQTNIVSCPKCKRRFDYVGKEVEPEKAKVDFDSYSSFFKWLEEAKKISGQCSTLKEVLKRTQNV